MGAELNVLFPVLGLFGGAFLLAPLFLYAAPVALLFLILKSGSPQTKTAMAVVSETPSIASVAEQPHKGIFHEIATDLAKPGPRNDGSEQLQIWILEPSPLAQGCLHVMIPLSLLWQRALAAERWARLWGSRAPPWRMA